MNMNRIRLGLAALGLLGATASAQAIPTTLIYVNSSVCDIYVYDAGNAYNESLVAGGVGAFSISSGPAANTLYIQQFNGALATYNLTTSALTNIGGLVPGNSLGEGRDGSLYAGSGAQLDQIAPSTGVSTLIGAGTYGYAGDIAVDPTNLSGMYGAVLVGSDVALALIDKATGAQSLLGSFGLSGGSIFGLGFSLDGTLFAAGPTANGGGLYTVNKSTGAATLVRSVSYQPYDMATQPFERKEPTDVPEPASLALVALGLVGATRVRRR